MICIRAPSWASITTLRIFHLRSKVRSRSTTSFDTTKGLDQVRQSPLPMPSRRMSFWLNFRSDINSGRPNSPTLKKSLTTGRWRVTSRLVIMRYPPFSHVERHHLSPFPCMKEEYHPRKANILIVLIVSMALASCASNVRIINETATGGTVLYPYIEEQEVLTY